MKLAQMKLAQLDMGVRQARLACVEFATAKWSTHPAGQQQPAWRPNAHALAKDIASGNLDVSAIGVCV